MSLGKDQVVHCIRLNAPSHTLGQGPGEHGLGNSRGHPPTKTWPSEKKATSASVISFRFPMITFSTLSMIRLASGATLESPASRNRAAGDGDFGSLIVGGPEAGGRSSGHKPGMEFPGRSSRPETRFAGHIECMGIAS